MHVTFSRLISGKKTASLVPINTILVFITKVTEVRNSPYQYFCRSREIKMLSSLRLTLHVMASVERQTGHYMDSLISPRKQYLLCSPPKIKQVKRKKKQNWRTLSHWFSIMQRGDVHREIANRLQSRNEMAHYFFFFFSSLSLDNAYYVFPLK